MNFMPGFNAGVVHRAPGGTYPCRIALMSSCQQDPVPSTSRIRFIRGNDKSQTPASQTGATENQTDFRRVYDSSEWIAISLPHPLSLNPPNGLAKS
jgi:hypothetical protein